MKFSIPGYHATDDAVSTWCQMFGWADLANNSLFKF